MKASRRAQRMAQHYARSRRSPAFNVISLMDIFTILVFFLLVNTSEVEVLPNAKDIALPESVAETKPRESVVVLVTGEQVLLRGKPVVTLADIQQAASGDIQLLRHALQREADQIPPKSPQDPGREVTIMGDKTIPYTVLKKVMLSCTRAGFSQISLSVIQKPAQQG